VNVPLSIQTVLFKLMEKYKIQKGNIHNYKLVMDVAT